MDVLACCYENMMDDDRVRIAAGLRRGDPDVLDRLIEQYQHRLFRYLLSITARRATAEDLFQDTWLRVLERGRQYRPEWKFESWLFAIARNLAIDLARRKKAGSLDELLDPEEGWGMEPPDATPSPLDQVLAREERDRMARDLMQIAPAYREVLVLRFQESLSLEEIARIIGAPLSTAKSRLYRGLDALRRAVDAN